MPKSVLKKAARTVVAIAAAIALARVSGLAQTNRGAITGNVTDPHGAAVAAATVTIVNTGTNQTVIVKSSETGSYQSPGLDPVTYRVMAEAPGFKQGVFEDVKVDTASTTTIDIKLQIGETIETVTVTAESPLINPADSAPGSTITQNEIEHMPLGDRFVLGLALMVPNVSGQTTTEEPGVFTNTLSPGVGLNINGSRPGEGSFLADGVNNTGVGMSRAVVTFSPDTVQEFNIKTSNFSAEYGSTGGGVVNTTTKSGTNQFHGVVSTFLRNPAFNAIPFTDATVRPPSQLRAINGAATLGGPVRIPKIYDGHNKTFFFVAVEPKWRTDAVSLNNVLPPDNWRNGDFSDAVLANGNVYPLSVAQQYGLSYTPATIYQQYNQNGNQLTQITAPAAGQTFLPFPNNTIPKSLVDPTSQKVMAAGYPPAQPWFTNSGTPYNYLYFRGIRSINDQVTIKIDHALSSKTRISGRYTTVPNHGDRPRGFFAGSNVNQLQTTYSASKQVLLSVTTLLSNTLVNDLKVNYLRGNYQQTNAPPWDVRNWSKELGLPAVLSFGLPIFNFGQGLPQIGQTANPFKNAEDTYNLTDALSWSHGNHSLKFGADLRRNLLNQTNYGQAAGGNYSFNANQTNSGGAAATGGSALASFLLGVPNSVSLASAVYPYYYRFQSGAFYVQDDWKIAPTLTLNLGVRYSLDFPRTEKNSNQGILDLANAVPVAMPTQLLNTNGTPYTALPSSLIPTTTLQPSLVFSGHGRSSYLFPPDYKKFQPRLGLAWRPKLFGLNRGARGTVVRAGWGLTYLPLTGNNLSPNPDFTAGSQSYTPTSGALDSNYVMRLSSNPPALLPPNNLIQIPSDGILTNALAYQSTLYAVNPNFKNPSSQTWSLSVQNELSQSVVLEYGYQGNKGTHLMFPKINVNRIPFGVAQAVDALNIDLRTTSVQDPLGRHTVPSNSNSAIINVPLGSVLAPYAGFSQVLVNFDSNADSIRHAGYVSLSTRFSRGLTARFNYTFQKTLTDASDFGLCSDCQQGHRIWTQISSGATYRQERSVAGYNQPHVFTGILSYELPVGRSKALFASVPGWLDRVMGGWLLSAVGNITSGTPFIAALYDGNGLSAVNAGSNSAVVRANLVPGVPVKNPSWSASCGYGANCPTYLNAAAFTRPAIGQLGDVPSVIPWLYAPFQKNVDISVVKQIKLPGERSRRYIELRGDAFNALNYRGYRIASINSFNGAYVLNGPSNNAADITAAQYNTWAATWNPSHLDDQVPATAVVSGSNNPVFQQIVSQTAAPKATNGGLLPVAFFSVPIPQNMGLLNANSFDLRTLSGLKNYYLRNAYNTTWGTLSDPQNSRYLQVAIRIVF